MPGKPRENSIHAIPSSPRTPALTARNSASRSLGVKPQGTQERAGLGKMCPCDSRPIGSNPRGCQCAEYYRPDIPANIAEGWTAGTHKARVGTGRDAGNKPGEMAERALPKAGNDSGAQ